MKKFAFCVWLRGEGTDAEAAWEDAQDKMMDKRGGLERPIEEFAGDEEIPNLVELFDAREGITIEEGLSAEDAASDRREEEENRHG